MPPSHYRAQTIPRYLPQADVQAFFGVISKLRDRALFILVYHYGLRVSEVALLTREDVDLARAVIVIRRVKGGSWAERPLFSSTIAVLRAYLAERSPGTGTALFLGRRNAPLQKRRIQALFTRYRGLAGLSPRVTCHSLRHSIATHLLDAGASLEFVQDHLGHRDIRSTTIYARLTNHRRLALFQKLESSPWIVQPPPGPEGPGRKEVP